MRPLVRFGGTVSREGAKQKTSNVVHGGEFQARSAPVRAWLLVTGAGKDEQTPYGATTNHESFIARPYGCGFW